MKVSVVRGGGLAGLVKRTAVKSDTLPPEHAEQLRSKVDEAGVLDLSDGPKARYPDEMSYKLTIEQDDGEHTVRLSESALPEAVRDLIDWIDSLPDREESIRPPGGTAR
jgi:hypothetical protein